MSTASKGKQRERELVNIINERSGLTAERVPRSVADATPVDDVVVVPDELEGDGDRPITRKLQRLEMEIDDLLQVEVKYTSSGGYGLATLRDAHLRTVGLGLPRPLQWEGGWRTGGMSACVCHLYEGDNTPPVRSEQFIDDMPPKTAMKVYDETVDAVAFREAREPWVMLWRRDDG